MGGVHSDSITFFDDMVDPQSVAEEHELHRMVMHAIRDLSAKDKEATLLFYYEQLTLQEIAALLGVSVGTVKGRLHRARKQLRERLSPEYVSVPRGIRREKSMKQVTIDAVREHPGTRQYFVVVKDERDVRLVLWIGKVEALTIAAGLTEISPPRPIAVHLMASLFSITGMQHKEARIEAIKDDIFYAVITIRHDGKEHEIDARPSDALSLAVLMKRPIYVAEVVMERCGALPEEETHLLGELHEVDREAV